MAQVLLAHTKGIGKTEACPTGAERSVAQCEHRASGELARARGLSLEGEILYTLKEAQVLVERRRRHYKWYYADYMLMYRRHIACGEPIEHLHHHLQPCGGDQAGVEDYG